MENIEELLIGDVVFVSDRIKDVTIFNKKIGQIQGNQYGLFLGYKKHNHKKDVFWTVELLIENKKIIMFSPTNETMYFTKLFL
jgi:hypothetical protein